MSFSAALGICAWPGLATDGDCSYAHCNLTGSFLRIIALCSSKSHSYWIASGQKFQSIHEEGVACVLWRRTAEK